MHDQPGLDKVEGESERENVATTLADGQRPRQELKYV